MKTLGIRFEDKSIWERRVPLSPAAVTQLVDNGARVLVESSDRRVYPDAAYLEAGAEVVRDLSDAEVVFGVKEIPLDKLLADRVYVFFAHVIKGQPYNMPLLERLLDQRCTLIDYERIARDGKRLVAFSREAGQAGMIDSLHFLGRRLALEGHHTPLAEIRPAHGYSALDDAKGHLVEVASHIRRDGLDLPDLPVVVGFTGKGRVSQGALDVFDLLDPLDCTPEDLAGLSVDAHRNRLVKVQFRKKHLVEPKDPAATFDQVEYRTHPERYQGGPLPRFLPHVTLLVHGVFWTAAYPRFLTRRQTAEMWRAGGRKLRVFGDVTCDIDGSVEMTYKATQPDHPTYVYNPLTDSFQDGVEGEGILVLAVDNLPCELPRDASRNFSKALSPFVESILRADFSKPFDALELPDEIRDAVITHQGELTPSYRYLAAHLGRALRPSLITI